MHIYIDESGDLGFDFSKGATSHFTITALVIEDSNVKKLEKAVSRTIKNKINIRKKTKKKPINELKGSSTNIKVKKYFWHKTENIPFLLYSITLNKERVYPNLQRASDRLYNYIARLIIDKIPLDDISEGLLVHIDRSKGKHGREEFNKYIENNIKARIHPKLPLRIYHVDSVESKGVQATDMFSWGILRKYKNNDTEWVSIFESKIKCMKSYLPPNNWKTKKSI